MPMIAAIVWVDQQLLEQLTRGTLPEVIWRTDAGSFSVGAGSLVDIRVHGLMVSGVPQRTNKGNSSGTTFVGGRMTAKRNRDTALCHVQVMEASEQAYRAFQRQVQKVCTLILFERPECEIERARIELRSEAKRLFPDKAQLYEIIYESRFRRLCEQFCKQRGDSR